jgi:hypothetical protein
MNKKDKIYIPKDLMDSFVELTKILQKKDINQIKNTDEDNVTGRYHFNLGMYLRNRWGLWRDSRLSKFFNKLGIKHTDDMSGIILTSFWRHLNNKDIKLNKQIDGYKKYWKNQEK